MRLWPYQMLDTLPSRHLLSQWRECLAIGGMLGANTLNHATVNRVKDYPIEHFYAYCDLVRKEFLRRGYTIGTNTLEKLENDIKYPVKDVDNSLEWNNVNYEIFEDYSKPVNKMGFKIIKIGDNEEFLFENFHNERYLKQCLYMFEEKYDCDMLYEEDWNAMSKKFKNLF